MSLQVIIILSCIVTLLVGIIIVMWLRSKHKAAYIPHGWLFKPEEIEKTLFTARDQRSKFEVQFHSENEKRKSTFCSVVDVHEGVITLECSGLTNINRNWMGKIVDCYFKVQDDKRNDRYYMFSSSIAGIRPVANEISNVSITIPSKLEQKQKRGSLRVDPPEQYIMGIAIWPEKLNGDGTHDMNIKNWGKPLLSFIPGKRAQVRLGNISAGGLKIHVKRQDAKDSGLAFNIGDRFFVLLDLWEPETGQRQRYWLLCRLQLPFIDFETRDVDLGLQFLRRAETTTSVSELVWSQPLKANEVDDIGNWAIKRHLELYREKGLE